MSGNDDNDNQHAFMDTARRLVGLAGLAERASLRAMPVLCLVLWILRPAEAVARQYVIDLAEECGVWFDMPASFDRLDLGEGWRADALRLALAFRLLASMLKALSALPAAREPHVRFRLSRLERLLSGFSGGPPEAGRHGSHIAFAGCAPAWPDTS